MVEVDSELQAKLRNYELAHEKGIEKKKTKKNAQEKTELQEKKEKDQLAAIRELQRGIADMKSRSYWFEVKEGCKISHCTEICQGLYSEEISCHYSKEIYCSGFSCMVAEKETG